MTVAVAGTVTATTTPARRNRPTPTATRDGAPSASHNELSDDQIQNTNARMAVVLPPICRRVSVVRAEGQPVQGSRRIRAGGGSCSVARQRENRGAVLGDGQRVLGVRGTRAVGRPDRPPVGIEVD